MAYLCGFIDVCGFVRLHFCSTSLFWAWNINNEAFTGVFIHVDWHSYSSIYYTFIVWNHDYIDLIGYLYDM